MVFDGQSHRKSVSMNSRKMPELGHEKRVLHSEKDRVDSQLRPAMKHDLEIPDENSLFLVRVVTLSWSFFSDATQGLLDI